jgi:WS/DGAT/MGAT family acyltransferase
MPRYSYERLSAQDNSFLLMEKPSVYMHVAGTQIFEAGPLRNAEGGIDIKAVKRSVESVLHLIPRYRQKLRWIPYENHPVWVDDRRFSLDYHIRHTALPRPGNDEQLKKLAGRIMAQLLDRTKPLWEYWVIEGLQGDRFAVVSKIHHCMIDGASGADLAQIMMSLGPDREPQEVLPYIPRRAPSASELFRDEWTRRLSLPLAAIRSLREFNRQTEDRTVGSIG